MPITYSHLNTLSIDVTLQPTLGGFVAEGLEILGGPILKTVAKNGTINWGFLVGAQYYLDFQFPVIPFAGLHFQVSMNRTIAQTFEASFAFPIGILVPLNEHIGLEIALKTEVLVNGQSFFNALVISPGYFGVRGFF